MGYRSREGDRQGQPRCPYCRERKVCVKSRLARGLGLTSTVIPCSLHSMATAPRRMLSSTQTVECVPSLLPVN